MLPEASVAFLDELLNANSAILNSLLMVLNERVFRRGRETRRLPLLMVVGASNRLPEDDALGALFDRFLLRVRCDNVPDERLLDVIDAGWKLDVGLREGGWPAAMVKIENIARLQSLVAEVDFSALRTAYRDLVLRIRRAGMPLSDRRAVKLQRLVAGSALLCGRRQAHVSDLWIFRHLWDREEQREVLAGLVKHALGTEPLPGDAHPQARESDRPDPESLARDLEHLKSRLTEPDLPPAERSRLRDRLGTLAGRVEWVTDEQRRAFLTCQLEELWALTRSSSQG
jgi:MoxR-like ATPase